MYDIRQFKPTLYLVVILGLTGFAVAAEQPALWFLAIGAVLINAWLVRTGRFTPMPRWLSNGITLLSSAFVMMQVIGATNTPILLIGQFLVLLHLVKLFEQRANRDYAQLLVLSLLLMVASAISTASLAFGVLFIAYLFISLYCCLLFHLKTEADKAKAAQPVPAEKFNAATLRQDQRYLPRSMRRLTGLISTVSMVAAVLVFLLFPRGTGAGMLGQLQMHQQEPLTGFNDQVQFNEVAKITQNDTPVGTVAVWHDEKPVSTGSLRLRGVTFDRYHRGRTGEWEWSRANSSNNMNSGQAQITAESGVTYVTPDLATRSPLTGGWRQAIHLDPIGSKALFALGGVRSFTAMKPTKINYYKSDETLQRQDNLNAALDYEVNSTGSPAPPPPPAPHVEQSDTISPELAAFARTAGGPLTGQPRVGLDGKPAGDARPATTDEQVARNIEQYLLLHFGYTLDLTGQADLFNGGKDPLAVFVTETKRGHCEFFAGAMTVACQSLGMRARMVAGFVTDEYNSLGGFFQVRQSHAHTWVEVLTPNHGWVTFDPTSGRELPPNETRSTLQRVKHVFDWLEAKWAGSVIAYDTDRRENLIEQLNSGLMTTTYKGSERLMRLRQQIQKINRWFDDPANLPEKASLMTLWVKTLAGVVTVMALVILAVIAWFIVDRRRIRRRAKRIGLTALPEAEQLRMARQLGFYEEMNELLERHRIARPAHLTPREFSRSLTFLPTEAYDLVDKLTRIFYRVRYGGANVPADQQRRLDHAVQRLATALGPSKV
jgi:transglutaminase-like putative cysteine protease